MCNPRRISSLLQPHGWMDKPTMLEDRISRHDQVQPEQSRLLKFGKRIYGDICDCIALGPPNCTRVLKSPEKTYN
ncbi:hypothetical protein CEXT_438781 [Caerostris extrusa]|uniref:Uncharacterized protein n=1 Tax=Caerostris extrusa TaxID=172846 RepID=A0AAV4YEP1_CAEEX|nr:hypothetical protein CEXT_438781 [Caerostris extrusa]